jgi:hypothetical protein
MNENSTTGLDHWFGFPLYNGSAHNRRGQPVIMGRERPTRPVDAHVSGLIRLFSDNFLDYRFKFW